MIAIISPSIPQATRNRIWIMSATHLIRQVNTISFPVISKYTISFSGCCMVMVSIQNENTMIMIEANMSKYVKYAWPKFKIATTKLACWVGVGERTVDRYMVRNELRWMWGAPCAGANQIWGVEQARQFPWCILILNLSLNRRCMPSAQFLPDVPHSHEWCWAHITCSSHVLQHNLFTWTQLNRLQTKVYETKRNSPRMHRQIHSAELPSVIHYIAPLLCYSIEGRQSITSCTEWWSTCLVWVWAPEFVAMKWWRAFVHITVKFSGTPPRIPLRRRADRK